MNYTHLIPVACLFLASTVVADERCDDSLADDRRAAAVAYLESTYPNGATPGASVLVTCEGETVFAYNAGMADIEWQQPISSNTRFRLGSISKPLTAVAVLQLVEQGRIELDTQISAYVPNLPDYMRAVTVRQLLSHTSGLPDILLTPALLPLARDWVSVQQVIGMQGKTPPRFAPGEQYDYSNFNYVLIAALIEAVEETSYGDFMDEDVFSRLGLLRSSYDSRLSILPERAQGYDTSPFGELLHSENIDASHTSAAGALLSSANDLGTWASLLMSGELLQADTLAEAWTATVLPNGEATSYGLGFNIAIENSRRVIWHNGLSSGFQAAFSMYPDHGLVVIVLSNSFYLPNTTAAMDRVAAIVLE